MPDTRRHRARPRFSLAYLTCPDLSAARALEVAEQAGYDHVSLRLLAARPGTPSQPLHEEPRLLADFSDRLADARCSVLDIEFVRLGPAFDANSCMGLLETGSRIGARALLVCGDDAERSRLAASYASLCEAARPFGLTVDLEPMPWTAVIDIPAALDVVERAGRPSNGGLLVDPLHVFRSDVALEAIANLDPALLHFAQLCDFDGPRTATLAEMLQDAVAHRVLPGEGHLDLRGLVGALPDRLPISVEIANPSRAAQLGPVAWARSCLIAAQALYDGSVRAGTR